MRKKVLLAIVGFFLLGIVCYLIISSLLGFSSESANNMMAGGQLHSPLYQADEAVMAGVSQENDIGSERFQRPSQKPPYPNAYTFKDFEIHDGQQSPVTMKFDHADDVILAYYGILREAANMQGYSGGCGTIGWSQLPYPYAYGLLTKETQKEISQNQFVKSFQGVGYTTLLQMVPAYAPSGTPVNVRYYMVELEVITGAKSSINEVNHQGSQFAYYYGLITLEKHPDEGWKIKGIDYISEDFLCAPTHGWFYFADAVVNIAYQENLDLIEKIDRIEQEGDRLYLYASGHGKRYLFDFVRLTNGYDILLHEYVLDQGEWKETNLLPDDWSSLKLSINHPQLSKVI